MSFKFVRLELSISGLPIYVDINEIFMFADDTLDSRFPRTRVHINPHAPKEACVKGSPDDIAKLILDSYLHSRIDD